MARGQASSSGDTRSSAIPSASWWRRPARPNNSSLPRWTSPASRKCAATGRSCATAAPTRTTVSSTGSSLTNSPLDRMPAEWERHAATWLALPHNASDWPGKFPPISWVYGEIVRHVAAGEIVRILVNSRVQQAQASRILKKVGVDLARVAFLLFPSNRGWTRDSGPIFVRTTGAKPLLAIARFHFNAWAKYKDWKKDDRIPELAAKRFKLPLINAKMVLEGGSIDVNGRGTLLTTEECLVDTKVQVRNPGFSRQDIEAVFRQTLGVTKTLWLGKGIAGDDTHGHVDDVCRFVNPATIVLCREDNPKDANYTPLAENRERLQGTGIEVIDLPMPAPLYFDGMRLPASYANFYIGNAAVLVPTFNDPKDRIALGILGECFSDRPVIGIHAIDPAWGLGTVHCLTQQEPQLTP